MDDRSSDSSSKPSKDGNGSGNIDIDNYRRKNFKNKDSNSGWFLEESNPSVVSAKYSNLVSEGILAGQRIAKISVVTLVGIGIVEILTGYYSGSVVATADD